MKRIRYVIILALALCFAAAAAYADECAYLTENGTHDWIYGTTEASCEIDGEAWRECAECGLYETQEVIKAEHSWADRGITKDPTCTASGEKLFKCSICGAQKKETIDAYGHSYGDWAIVIVADCTTVGQRKAFCDVCGQAVYESIDRKAHEYDEWVVTVEPDDHSMGRRTRRCVECGASSEEYFYPDGTLYRGMRKNDEVQQMQKMLIGLGFLAGEADGIFGKNTEQAVKDFQTHAEIEVTGIAYPQTLEAIAAEYALINGETTDYYAENGHPECCEVVAEEGVITFVLCERHYETLLAADEFVAGGEYEKAYECWKAELELIYTEWESASAGNKEAAENNKAAFYAWLEAQKEIWNDIGDSDTAALRMIEAVKAQCADICGIIAK